MHRGSFRVLACLAVILTGGLGSLRAEEYTFTTVDVPGAPETLIFGVNNAGTIVGQYGTFDFSVIETPGNHGFVLGDGVLTTVDYPGALATAVEAINDAGQMVGTFYNADGRIRGYVLDGEAYQEVMVPGSYDTFATGIDGSGRIIGYYTMSASRDTATGFLYDGQNYQNIVAAGFAQTLPRDINDAGQIVGRAISSESSKGFFYDAGVLTLISHPESFALGYTMTEVRGVNNDGLVVGTFQKLDLEQLSLFTYAFTWDASTGIYSDGFDLPGPTCPLWTGTGDTGMVAIADVNDDGTIVGYYDNCDGIYHGYVGETEGGGEDPLEGDLNEDGFVNSRDLDLVRSWWGMEVEPGRMDRGDANGDGVVNSGDLDLVRSNWGRQAAGAAAVPEPAGLCLLLLGAVSLGFRRRGM